MVIKQFQNFTANKVLTNTRLLFVRALESRLISLLVLILAKLQKMTRAYINMACLGSVSLIMTVTSTLVCHSLLATKSVTQKIDMCYGYSVLTFVIFQRIQGNRLHFHIWKCCQKSHYI